MSCRTSQTRRLVPAAAAIVILLCTFAQTSSALGAKAVSKHDVKRQVEALEQQWRNAQLAGDVDTMDKLLSEDYLGISLTGQVSTKEQQLDRLRRHLFQITRLDLADMKVKLLGQVAIVTSLASVEGLNNGKPVTGDFRYTRIYRHLPTGGWQIINFEATRLSRHSSAKSMDSLNEDQHEETQQDRKDGRR